MALSVHDDITLRKITLKKQWDNSINNEHINKARGFYYYHRDLKAIKGSKTVFSSIFLHLVNDESRNHDFKMWNETWNKLPKKHVFDDYGILFSNDTPGESLKEVFFEKIYTKFPGFTPKPEDVVFDVGSQYGDYALLCAKRYKSLKVVCFEPYSKNFDIMKENLRLNSCMNVSINNCAVGKQEGVYNIHISGNMATKDGVGIYENVNVVKLDSFLNEKVSLLKIDTEGFELDVLEGARETLKTLKPRIILETHSIELKRKCLNFLFQYGYKLACEGRTVKSEQNGMDYIQNLYLSPPDS